MLWSGCRRAGFNTQQPEGGWERLSLRFESYFLVSTHSSPKAAGKIASWQHYIAARFNTQQPEGGWL